MVRILTLMVVIARILGAKTAGGVNPLDNGVIGDPEVDCMEDRVRLTFRTEKPFHGRIFVKGMSDNDKCVSSFSNARSRPSVDFEVVNGECNMRRSRKISPEERGIEQSITIIISFHDTFITKVDKAYRCTCFYMEADKVVTSKFDVSMIPTTDLIDTAKMPLCTYSVRRGSVNGPLVNYATVGEPIFHVWQCESDMFSMLVHSCFVDDGAGHERKPLLDEHGCSIDTVIVPDLNYNHAANLAYTEVSAFKFADKVTTYFQCAVSTCMISEGMCEGKTPPRCEGSSNALSGLKRSRRAALITSNPETDPENNSTSPTPPGFDFTMDLSADKIIVLDLDDMKTEGEALAFNAYKLSEISKSSPEVRFSTPAVCLSHLTVVTIVCLMVISFATGIGLIFYFVLRKRRFSSVSAKF